MTAPYDHEALWLKAKLFVNRAMDETDERSFDEKALWASLALELLGKAALARVSPLLIAEPTEEGNNLLIASGLVEGDARFLSVRARTIYSRCHRAFKPFSDVEATHITNARNEYLHGSKAGFTSIPERAWWPRYWALAVVLIGALECETYHLVGIERAELIDKHLEQNKKNIENRTEMLIERAKQRLAQHRAGTLPAKVAGEWVPGKSMSAMLRHSTEATCPACKGIGSLEGDDVLESEVHHSQISDDDFEVTVELTVGSEYFSCQHCGLVLDNYQVLEQAGIEDQFFAEGDLPDYDGGEYGND